MYELMTDTLLEEYETLIAELGETATDDQITFALVSRHAWTARGAATIVFLAREYGTAILRNALSLASSLKIEDGSSRL